DSFVQYILLTGKLHHGTRQDLSAQRPTFNLAKTRMNHATQHNFQHDPELTPDSHRYDKERGNTPKTKSTSTRTQPPSFPHNVCGDRWVARTNKQQVQVARINYCASCSSSRHPCQKTRSAPPRRRMIGHRPLHHLH
ncbi:unnamed protein product, partial [Ectocarpus sp. 8 AP-2014]